MLAVDDEIYVYTLLQTAVRWGDTEFSLDEYAANGKVALEILKEENFDIVLVDLDMPVMDGFGLIQEIEKHYPNILVLVLSVYSDFEFIRKAFQMGAEDYIIKYEIEHGYVVKTMRNAITKSYMQNETKSAERQLGRAICMDTETALLDQRSKQGDMVILICDLVCKGDNHDEKKVISQEAEEEIYREMIFKYPSSLMIGFDGCLVMLVCLDMYVVSEKWLWERLEKLASDIRECVRRFEFTNTVFGASGYFQSTRDIKKQYRIAKNRLRSYFLYDNRLILFRDLKDGEIVFPDLRVTVEVIVEGLSEGNKETVLRMTEKMEREIRSQEIPNREAVIIYMIRILSQIRECLEEKGMKELWAIQSSVEVYNSLMTVRTLRSGIHHMNRFLEKLADDSKDWGSTKEERMISRAVKYMESHFSEEVPLTVLSREIGFSANYFSSLFMKIKGCSFSAYLFDIRIKHAKKLLISSDKKIYEIARECGYSSVEHFSRSFKKAAGVSPAHYKDTHNQ